MKVKNAENFIKKYDGGKKMNESMGLPSNRTEYICGRLRLEIEDK